MLGQGCILKIAFLRRRKSEDFHKAQHGIMFKQLKGLGHTMGVCSAMILIDA